MNTAMLRMAALTSLLVVAHGSAHSALAEYDCHVVLANNRADIVLVEATDRPRAEALALRAVVPQGKARPQAVRQLKECVLRHTERFSDPAMEVRRKSKPL